ncbi:Fc receptor-like protein 5 isoform X17 [Herpailurus yagouaroundi]|uniref:Fc receptor-like protein 5 isoform X17 n=1 Tax=Herpailurus yagouaroundi TaxID=1608482 RepID=UPI001AD67FCD|nr:Fc receptor-like protein 5 isoform X17 [Puma yagouaroundi]
MLLWSLLVILAPVDGKSDWLTLVAPSAVFEGDRIDLTCQRKNDWWKVTRVSYHKDGEELQFSSELSNFSIQRAVLSDSGTYHCAVALVWPLFSFQKEKTSRSVRIEVQELFPRPVLTVSPFRAVEGNPVTLTCETKLSPQRSDAQLQFCFFRDGRALGSGWSSSPELRVPAMWSGDSGSYWCEAETVTPRVRKQSLQSQIHVRGVPVSNVSLEMRAPRGQVIEGRNLVLLCSVTEGTGNITFSWHREATGTSVGKKTQRSLSVELEVPAVQERDAGRYYCRADNGHGPIQSKVLSILVRIPVSCPILSITAPRAQAVEGDVVELRCEAQRGSPPILYRFYYEDVPLGNSSAPSGGGASFNLSLTAEHSGNYSCEADNGLGARRSEVVPLSLSVPVSPPVLTIRRPRSQAVEGDVVELHCEAQRGSPPILYRFYHEDVPLGSSSAPSGGEASLNLSLTAEHSGNYSCEANNSLGVQRSKMVSLSITVPVSHPVLTLNPDVAQAMVGDVLELRCEAQRGSPPILYWFYHEDVILGNTSAPFGGGASFNLSLTTEHSGNYSCGADNGLGAQSSEMVSLNITVPASRPVLTVRTPRAQAVEGDVVELRCEAQRGSPPILYRFYREDVPLESSSAPSGGGTSFYLSLTTEHSGNYSCEADNGLGAQRSEVVPLSVIVPVSHPTLTLRAPGAQAKVGDMVELRCEAQRGSPPIWYRFYHEDVPLGNSSAPSGGGASLNLSLTAEHSGNYSCEADNGLGARRSEAVPLSMSGLTGSRSGPIATGVTGGLFSTLGFGVVALLLYCRLPRKAGGRPTSDPSRSPADSDVREPVYRNAPAWLELQPVYSNVNPKGGEVVYSEVRRIPQGSKPAANSDSVLGLLRTHLPSHGQAASHRPSDPPGSSVIYSQVKVACPSACVAPQS